MKNIIKKVLFWFTPTEKFADMIKNLQVGDILYVRQGAFPHKEVAGYQIVTSLENKAPIITWGGAKLSDLKEIQKSLVKGDWSTRMIYWNDFVVDPQTGLVKDHGDLRVNFIYRANGEFATLFPSNKVYYICQMLLVGIVFLIFCGLFLWFAYITS